MDLKCAGYLRSPKDKGKNFLQVCFCKQCFKSLVGIEAEGQSDKHTQVAVLFPFYALIPNMYMTRHLISSQDCI